MQTIAPKISSVMAKKYPGKPAIFLNKEIVYIGEISSKKNYEKIMKKLMEKYPEAKETDFGFTFIFGKKNYILACT